MKVFISAVLILFVCTTVLFSADLKTYQATYEKEMGDIVVDQGAKLSELKETYSKALGNLLEQATSAGDLNKARAVMAETERFTKDQTVSSENAENSSPDLKKLQLAYLQTVQTLASSRARNVVSLVSKYDVALAKLQTSLTKQKKLDDALAVQNERKAVATSETVVSAKALLSGVVKAEIKVKPKKPAFASLPMSRPKVYADDTQGQAGLTAHKNIYSIEVKETPRKASFTFWASGDIGLDSYGKVLLTTPDGKEHEIYEWSPNSFRKTANSAKSYKDLKPVTCDVSNVVNAAGKHEFEFKYTHGSVALRILRVELEVK